MCVCGCTRAHAHTLTHTLHLSPSTLHTVLFCISKSGTFEFQVDKRSGTAPRSQPSNISHHIPCPFLALNTEAACPYYPWFLHPRGHRAGFRATEISRDRGVITHQNCHDCFSSHQAKQSERLKVQTGRALCSGGSADVNKGKLDAQRREGRLTSSWSLPKPTVSRPRNVRIHPSPNQG